jgi:2-hydroxycyclohexanecarboxyl-CoA dehydrogenase
VRFEGKAALVTGAGAGVGRAIALRLAGEGASVAVNDVSADAAAVVVAEIEAAGGRASVAAADVTDYDQVATMVGAAVATLGRLDILVNNAGNRGTDPRGWTFAPFWESQPDEWRSFVDVNLYGVLNCCRHVLPVLVEQGTGGRLVTIVSEAARTGEPYLEVYAAAKAGAAGFMRSIAKSVGRYGITANSVALGTITSPGWEAMADDEYRERLRPYLVRRPGRPDEVAALVAHLASDDGEWITGQTYPINGGIATS